MLLFDFLVLTE